MNEDTWSHLVISSSKNIDETLCIVEAEDPDGDQLWWSIMSGNLNNIFSIRFKFYVFFQIKYFSNI